MKNILTKLNTIHPIIAFVYIVLAIGILSFIDSITISISLKTIVYTIGTIISITGLYATFYRNKIRIKHTLKSNKDLLKKKIPTFGLIFTAILTLFYVLNSKSFDIIQLIGLTSAIFGISVNLLSELVKNSSKIVNLITFGLLIIGLILSLLSLPQIIINISHLSTILIIIIVVYYGIDTIYS